MSRDTPPEEPVGSPGDGAVDALPDPRDETLAGETVLVTGGAGFVGSHLVDALVPENEVRVLDDLSTGTVRNLPDGADLVEGDVRDAETVRSAMAGADVTFHQAANPSVERSVDRPEWSHSVNVRGTLTVLEAARAEDSRVITASSTAIYGQPETTPVSEDDPKRPESPYGLEKLTADHYTRLYHELYGLETVSLRYFNVYGPRQTASAYSGVIGIFLDRARSDEPIPIDGDGRQTRDFVHVRDVVRANLAAATTDAVGDAFNVGTGESTTIVELAEAVRAAADSDSEIVHGEPRPGDVQHSRADVTRARERLDYSAEISLEEGLTSLTG